MMGLQVRVGVLTVHNAVDTSTVNLAVHRTRKGKVIASLIHLEAPNRLWSNVTRAACVSPDADFIPSFLTSKSIK